MPPRLSFVQTSSGGGAMRLNETSTRRKILRGFADLLDDLGEGFRRRRVIKHDRPTSKRCIVGLEVERRFVAELLSLVPKLCLGMRIREASASQRVQPQFDVELQCILVRSGSFAGSAFPSGSLGTRVQGSCQASVVAEASTSAR